MRGVHCLNYYITSFASFLALRVVVNTMEAHELLDYKITPS